MGIWAEIKYALNSTLGTANFSPIDTIIKDGQNSIKTTLQSLINQKSTAILGGTQKFTANGTFTVPANVTKIWITACAGGQAGKGNSGNTGGVGAGCGGDWLFREPYSVTPGQKLTITVGKGGDTKGKVGGSTVISPLVTLTCPGQRGGGGGFPHYASSSDSDSVKQNNGQDGFAPGGRGSLKSAGGGGSLGRGGDAGNVSDKLNTGYGGGGGSSGSTIGEKGGDGIVIIEW